jgi:dephospho-CoA kinase
MLVIGVAGGIASGKSLIAEGFRTLGAFILDADRVGHEVLRDQDVMEALYRRWGNGVLDAQGQVVRSAVAEIVFAPPPAGPEELAFLESVTHPRIEQRLESEIDRVRASQRFPAVVLDAAVLFEAGWSSLCDRIVFVEAPRALRRQRARERGWSEQQFTSREATQQPLASKRDRADVVIKNSETPSEAFRQVAEAWNSFIH